MKTKLSLQKAIKNVVNYYAFFDYAPSLEEIHTFLSIKTTNKVLNGRLGDLIVSKKIISQSLKSYNLNLKSDLYTLPGHRIFFKKRVDRNVITANNLKKIAPGVKILSGSPAINLIGLSGSAAMGFMRKRDDIDLFIITSSHRLWMARFIAVSIALIMGLKRHRGSKKVSGKLCLNLFFDGTDLSVPPHKRNLYTAHEVLQMKPLIVKNDSYEKFLAANKWVHDFFPNVKFNAKLTTQNSKPQRKTQNFLYFMLPVTSYMLQKLGDVIEFSLKKLQLFLINRHKTSEIVTITQLWFHPDDFEKRLRKKGMI